MKRVKSLLGIFLTRNIYSVHILHVLSKGKLRPAIIRFCGAKVGKNVQLGPFVYWDPHLDMLEIGDNVIVGPQVCFIFHDRDLSEFEYGSLYLDIPHKLRKITLCKNCRVGTRALILPGVTIGEGACVGAGALVAKDVPAWSVVAGVPAKVIKTFEKKEENEL